MHFIHFELKQNKWKLMFPASSQQCSRNLLELYIKPGTCSKRAIIMWTLPISASLCLRPTGDKAVSFLRAAPTPTAGVVERRELPALKFPACPRSPLKPLGPSFVLPAWCGAKGSVRDLSLWATLESAAHSQWKGTASQKFGRTSWFSS